ncbi:hypothetical protein P9112_010672 [Eukaryota sp. TZLM1-RC]
MSLDLQSVYSDWKRSLLHPTGLLFSSHPGKVFTHFWKCKTKGLMKSIAHRLAVFLICLLVISLQNSFDLLFSNLSIFTLFLICCYFVCKYSGQIFGYLKNTIYHSPVIFILAFCSLFQIKVIVSFLWAVIVCLIELALITSSYLFVFKRVICILHLQKVLKTLPQKIRWKDSALTVGKVQLTEEECLLLLEAVKRNSVQSLDLSGTQLSSSFYSAIKDVLVDSEFLGSLQLSGSGVSLQNLADLTQGMAKCQSLTRLDLSSNKLGPKGAEQLARVLINQNNIEEIALSRNSFKDKGVGVFSDVFRHCTSLKKAILWCNDFGLDGARMLCSSLFDNTNLIELDVANNMIGVTKGDCNGISFVADLIKRNKALELLDLSGNKIDTRGFKLLLKALSFNTTLKVIKLARNNFFVQHNGIVINRIVIVIKSPISKEPNRFVVVSLTDEDNQALDLIEMENAVFDPQTGGYYVIYTREDGKIHCDQCSGFDRILLDGENLSVKPTPNVAQADPSLHIVSGSETECDICYGTANEPIRLTCGHNVCTLQCLVSWVKKSSSCPSCHSVIHGVIASHSLKTVEGRIADVLEADIVTFDFDTGNYFVFFMGNDAGTRYEEAFLADDTYCWGANLSIKSYVKDEPSCELCRR